MPTRPEVVLGPETFDDAGVIKLGTGPMLVQTVDFFPPIVDDPMDFGRIAAANSLSDIYAMGATPYCALNIVGFPRKKLDLAVLRAILEGGAEKMREANVALLGGHTVEDAEVKYGLAVTGLVDRQHLRTNAAAKAGDALVLTKPLGMGALSTAIQQEKGSAEDIARAIATMATLNAGAAHALAPLDVHAVTDVTGFGLLGHASEMARAASVTLRFEAAALPFTPGARELAADGVLSGGSARNRSYLGDYAEIAAKVPRENADLAFDSETSGGLLIALPEEHVATLIAALQAEETPCAVRIGKVLPRDGELWVRLDK